jgi:quercetin dioxygenase-like cupin family protein
MRVSMAGVLVAVVLASAAAAQIPVTSESHHRTVYENADLRVLDVRIGAGDATADHRHDHDIATISMSAGSAARIQNAGQPAQNRQPRPFGDTTITEYTGKALSHTVENVGSGTYQLFAVENLRAATAWAAGAPLSAAATTTMVDGRALRVYDVRLVPATPQTSHTHAVPTVAVLMSGIVMSEGSDAQAKANPSAPIGLKRMDQVGQWVLIPRGETHTVVRLGTMDARLLEVEVR